MQHNKQQEEFKGSEHKPLRYTKDSFTRELIGKPVHISLITGEKVQGRLTELGMYDVLIQTLKNSNVVKLIILKSAIISVEVE